MIAVGTDSLSSSPSLDLLEDVALLFDLARAQGMRTRTWLAASCRRRPWAVPPRWAWRRVPTAWVSSDVGRGRRHVRRRVPVTSIVETIDTVARHGAGRVVETIVSGRVRYSASR